MLRLGAPFGEALLDIRTESASATLNVPTRQVPPLPQGMRVDQCDLYTLSLNAHAGEALLVELRLLLSDSWTAHFASGESLDAFELLDDRNCVAAIGMRDPDWLSVRHDLEVVEANHPTGTLQTAARFKVIKGGPIEVQAAIAWTNQPTTEPEEISPWFAIDKAMIF